MRSLRRSGELSIMASEKPRVPSVPGVPANAGAALRRNTSKSACVPRVPKLPGKDAAGTHWEHMEHHPKTTCSSANPSGARLEHREHMEHQKTRPGSRNSVQIGARRPAEAASSQPPAPHPGRVLIQRKPSVLAQLGVSDTTLRRWMADDGFPRPRQLGPRAVGWIASEVEAWLHARPTAGTHGAGA